MMSAGAVVSGLAAAAIGRATQRIAAVSALLFGAMLLVAALMPSYAAEILAMAGVGAASTVFVAQTNSVLQLEADPAFRGRVMSLFAIAFLGTTPIGSPLVGWIAERFGPRMAFGFGAVVSLVAAGVALALLARVDRWRSRRYPVSTQQGRVLIEA